MNIVQEDLELYHYGMPRRSGRYPWGSGDNGYQHNEDFVARVERLKKEGWTPTSENIKKEFGEHVTLKDYRAEVAWANYERRVLQIEKIRALRDDGITNRSEIARRLGINESTVRSLENERSDAKMREVKNTYDFLKARVDETGMVDIGKDVEKHLRVSREKLDTALYKLRGEGYEVYAGGVKQINAGGQQTNQLVLCKPGTKHGEIYNLDKIASIKDFTCSEETGEFRTFKYPESLDSKRMQIRYADDVGPDGFKGIDKDGVVEIRRGVKDLSLSGDNYSQVRILVDGTHYIKGMAVYSDNLPDGVDVMFNTNKTRDKSLYEVLKPIKEDKDNPFGALISPRGQNEYTDDDGNVKLGLINKTKLEGDWTEWKDALPSQFLSKQSKYLAEKQLNLAKADKYDEFDVICKLENPTVKKHLLEKFADSCDGAAVNLQAAALPGQKYHVIIPINTLTDREVYAPRYETGTKLALVRYPHGGTFEIPILTVNNKNKLAQQVIGSDSPDAIGINKHIADLLSGADFDGDTVMCIPTHDAAGKVRIQNQKPLDELKDFDPKTAYAEVPGMTYMKYKRADGTEIDSTQKEMGVISNLITDMTLQGASNDKLARAVKHSMVVIDAAKHKLDYKRSEIENNIDALKKEFQQKENGRYGGAGTLVSRAKGEESVLKRQGTYRINVPEINGRPNEFYDPTKPLGAKIYKVADDVYYPVRQYDKETKTFTYTTTEKEGRGYKKITFRADDAEARAKYDPGDPIVDADGNVTFKSKDGTLTYKGKSRTQKSTRMAEADDAYKLVSTHRHPMELLYADYANSMKSLGNEARLEMLKTTKIKHDAQAKKVYQAEYDSLMNKLHDAEKNTVLERAALRKANVTLQEKSAADPSLSKKDLQKIGTQAMTASRAEVGALTRKQRNIEITDREWEAIQAGAISETILKRILNNTDIDKVRERATPRTTTVVTEAKKTRIQALANSNYTLEEIAKKVGLSTSAVSKYLKGAK